MNISPTMFPTMNKLWKWLRRGCFEVVSRVMRKFVLALAEIYFRGRVHAPWLPSSGQGAKGQGRRYAARLALDPL